MKKLLPLMVVGILVLSGLGAVGLYKNTSDKETIEKTVIFSTEFSPLVIEESDQDYVKLRLKDTSSYLMNPGQPMLPKVVKTFELPFGVKNVNVEVVPSNIYEYEISKEIRPASEPMPLISVSNNKVMEPEKDNLVYDNNKLFPSTWHKEKIGCLYNDND